MTASLETAGKVELRLLCKSNGVKGYGNMTTEQMRSALRAHAPERLTDTVPVKPVDVQPLPVTDDGHTPIRAARQPKKSAPKKSTKSDAPSIREWLEARLAKGELKVEDALAYAEKSGRSKVTVYRQARELGYSARKGEFVKAKVRS
jgi:hypothetical protein